jgi:hypothetical protein
MQPIHYLHAFSGGVDFREQRLYAVLTMNEAPGYITEYAPPYRANIQMILANTTNPIDITVPLAQTPLGNYQFNAQVPFWYTLPSDDIQSVAVKMLDATGNLENLNISFVAENPIAVGGGGATGFTPQHREGEFLIKDFTKLSGIQKVDGRYKIFDIDFIDTQTRSMLQASRKCKAIRDSLDPNFSLTYRTKLARNEEYSARITPSMREAMGEIARVIDFAATEIRTVQKFDLTNTFLLRTL